MQLASLVEQDRLGWDLLARLLGVVGVVEADGDEVARAGDGRAEAHAGGCLRQALRIDGAQLVERGRRQRRAGEVGDVAGEVADGAVAVDEARLFRAGVAKTHKLHGSALTVSVEGRKDRREGVTETLAIALFRPRQLGRAHRAGPHGRTHQHQGFAVAPHRQHPTGMHSGRRAVRRQIPEVEIGGGDPWCARSSA